MEKELEGYIPVVNLLPPGDREKFLNEKIVPAVKAVLVQREKVMQIAQASQVSRLLGPEAKMLSAAFALMFSEARQKQWQLERIPYMLVYQEMTRRGILNTETPTGVESIIMCGMTLGRMAAQEQKAKDFGDQARASMEKWMAEKKK